jgi:hypothetical protein
MSPPELQVVRLMVTVSSKQLESRTLQFLLFLTTLLPYQKSILRKSGAFDSVEQLRPFSGNPYSHDGSEKQVVATLQVLITSKIEDLWDVSDAAKSHKDHLTCLLTFAFLQASNTLFRSRNVWCASAI